jgi:acyl-CoA reductase-like NAD-dependent aldehyde dehydrogenase
MSYQVPDAALLPRHSMIAGGVRSDGSGQSMPHIYPATGRVTSQVRLASVSDVDAAVTAARKAAPAWRALTGDKRRDLMFKLAALVEQNSKQLAQLGTFENGSTLMTTSYLGWDAAQKFRYFGGWADKIHGETISTWNGPAHNYVAYEPYGVIGAIVPWNGPLFAATMVMTPALASARPHRSRVRFSRLRGAITCSPKCGRVPGSTGDRASSSRYPARLVKAAGRMPWTVIFAAH